MSSPSSPDMPALYGRAFFAAYLGEGSCGWGGATGASCRRGETRVTVMPERWQQVARIYELVAEHDPADRDAALEELCAGDESVRREVQSLLRQDDVSVLL